MDEGARSSMPKNRRTKKKNRARREKGFFTSHFACRRRQKTVQKRRVCEEEITNKKKRERNSKAKRETNTAPRVHTYGLYLVAHNGRCQEERLYPHWEVEVKPLSNSFYKL